MNPTFLLRVLWSVLLSALLAAPALAAENVSGESASDSLAAGDGAWTLRAESMDGRLAQPERIDEAIAAYGRALEQDPGDLEARWKLMRALHYSIDFTTLEEEEKDERADAITTLARGSADALESAEAVSPNDRAHVLFWSAIAWGTRAQRVGLLTIVTEGVAIRMHDQARDSLALDPGVDDGGALRLLSRLHATLPRVPFVSGWVDPDEALPLAERGFALDPKHPGNRLILALALEDSDSDDAARILELLHSVANATPRPGYLAEDEAIREQARARLAEREAD